MQGKCNVAERNRRKALQYIFFLLGVAINWKWIRIGVERENDTVFFLFFFSPLKELTISQWLLKGKRRFYGNMKSNSRNDSNKWEWGLFSQHHGLVLYVVFKLIPGSSTMYLKKRIGVGTWEKCRQWLQVKTGELTTTTRKLFSVFRDVVTFQK